ncbi:MAG: hypothetical protein HY671_11140 [Chloroflexi bacterium]|nr:hypothetical protein [Chloroflexota bacterium]
MCNLCECDKYIQEGKGAVLKRVTDILRDLKITAQNVDDFEATEVISGIIAPFGSREDDVIRTAAWVSRLHDGARQGGREHRYQNSVRAFEDIFSRLPVQGDPKVLATTFHQLEQLCRELDDKELLSADLKLREAVAAVNHVHDDMDAKVARLKAHYGL